MGSVAGTAHLHRDARAPIDSCSASRQGVRMAASLMPDEYACARCGARGCKLWRQPQTFTIELLCALCAATDQGAPIDGLTEYGTRPSEVRPGTMTNEIGKLMPAVPSGDWDGGYWGYTS